MFPIFGLFTYLYSNIEKANLFSQEKLVKLPNGKVEFDLK
jgi:hypothetical protein